MSISIMYFPFREYNVLFHIPIRCDITANARQSHNAGLTLSQRRRRWASVKSTLGVRLCLLGKPLECDT